MTLLYANRLKLCMRIDLNVGDSNCRRNDFDVCESTCMRNDRHPWYVIITGIRVVDLLIEVTIGGVVINNTAEASGLFGTSVCSRDSSEEAMESSLVV